MKNFKITAKEDGKEYWISRAMAVCGIIRAVKIPKTMEEKPKYFYLVSKRGSKCPDFVGKWQCTCGYLDYDETLADAVLREIKEETGLDIHTAILEGKKLDNGQPVVFDFRMIFINDDPEASHQNVTVRYLIDVNYEWIKELMDNGTINNRTEERGGEDGEVEEIRLVSCMDINEEPYKDNWAFNHGEFLSELGFDED